MKFFGHRILVLSLLLTGSSLLAETNHWAFQAPVRPTVPKVSDKKWVKDAVDNFILARLDKEKLTPAPETDKITLLRRLSLDLIGLPPTIAEVDAFVADTRKDAYEKQVERLLASPHFGERWGRHWLDAARYADSDGYEKDKRRAVWHYRDYVIDSINKDLPYNQFIIEQVAGDLLPNPTQDQIVATGFLRNSMVNEEGGVDPEQFRIEAMFDRMDCIGKSVLGLTIQCAQCHNHKFDPLKQEEYYEMFSFINNNNDSQQTVYSPMDLMKVADLRRQMTEIEGGLKHHTSDWEARMAKWESAMSSNQPTWTVVRPTVEDASTGGQKYLPQKDGSFLAQSYAPTKHTGKFYATNDFKNVTAFQLEVLTDENLPCNGPGRSFKGTFGLTEFEVDVASTNKPDKKTRVKFTSATSDYEQADRDLEPDFDDRSGNKRFTGSVKYAIDGNGNTAWGIDAGPGRRNVARKAVFQCETNIGFGAGTILEFALHQNHGGWNSDEHMNNNLGRFRFSVTTNAGPIVADPVPKAVRDIFAIAKEKRSPAQVAVVFSYWRTTVPEWKTENDKIEVLWKQWPEGTTTLSMMARADTRDTHILTRGDFLKPTKVVEGGVPAFLPPLPKNVAPTRLTFAKWLVDKKSPTTARVIVNRVWQTYFGIGLVNTPEDFGMRAETPSHPELLDWLACELMDHNWSLKHIHRLIVESAAYRQSSKVTPEMYERDPANRLLARGPRFRVEGEIVRDIALATSGLLTTNVGGPSVFSPAPAFLFQPPTSYAPFEYPEETGPNRYRRALYTFRRRSTPYPALQTFDTPNGDSSCVRRMRSNTPLQALTTLNETVYIECAQALAARVLADGGTTDDARVTYAFRRVLGRAPAADEKEELISLLQRQRQRIADGWLNPNEIATGSAQPKKLAEGATPTQLAAYTVVSRVLLNLDEAITKE